jgi:hypothetical protein
MVSASANSSGVASNLVTAVSATASGVVSGASSAEAETSIGTAASVFVTGEQAVAAVTGAPAPSSVTPILNGNSNIDAAVSPSPSFFAVGELGGAYSQGGSGSQVSTTSVNLTVNLAQLTAPQNLEIGLFDGTMVGSGFSSMTFTVMADGDTVLAQTFTDAAAAAAFFSDSAIILGSLSSGPLSGSTLSLSITDSLTTTVAGSGFEADFLVVATQSTSITDTTVPSEVVGGPYSGNENTAITLSGLSVSASPDASDPLTTVLSVSEGTITIGSQSGASVRLSGTAASITAALADASYMGDLNYSGPDTLTMTTTDVDDNNAASETASVTVNALVPMIAAPASLTLNQGNAGAISGVSLAEANSVDGETFTVTLSDVNGVLTASGTGVSGAETASLVITGSLAQVNADLATLSDTDAVAGSDTITLNAGDSFGNNAAPQQIAVTVNALVPMIAAPALLTLNQGNAGAISGVRLAEARSVDGETFTVTLSDVNGVLTASGTGVSGAETASLQITGSLAQVNADLATLSDTDAVAGSDTITINASDSFGNNAAPQQIAVTVNALMPVITAPALITVNQGNAGTIVGVRLAEANSVDGETFTVTLSDMNGVLTASGTGVSGAGTTSLSITGSLAQVNADLATLSDTDLAAGSDTITLNASDSFGNSAAPWQIAVTAQASLTAVSWVGESGTNHTGSWNTAADWSPSTVPGSTNDATISIAGTYTITSSQNNTVGDLTISDAGAILAIAPTTAHAATTFTTLNPDGASANAGTIKVEDRETLQFGGSFSNTGTITLASTGDPTTLQITGALVLEGSGTVGLSGNANNLIAGGTLTNEGNTISGAGSIDSALDNVSGRFEATTGKPLVLNGPVTNAATIESAASGGLTIAGDIANTGALVATAGTLTINTATVTNTGGGGITAASTVKLQGATVAGGTLAIASGGLVEAVGGATSTLDGVAVSNSGALEANGGMLNLENGTVTDPASDLVEAAAGSTIQLQGEVIDLGALTIAAGGTLEAVGGTTSTVDDVAVANRGVIEAIAGSTLTLENGTAVTDTSTAEVETSDAGSAVVLDGASIAGGTLNGMIDAVGGTDLLSGLSNLGTVTVSDGISLGLTGKIGNAGTIALASTGDTTGLVISGNVVLAGTGEVVLGGPGEAAIVSNGAAAKLTNDNTILGAGTLGDAMTSVTNAGVIDASGPQALIINTGANAITNSGTLEATGTGGLVADGAVANSGTLATNGGNLMIEGPLSGKGSATITGATLDLGAGVSAGQTVTFATATPGVLALGQAEGFAGTVAGLASLDAIDLMDFQFSGHPTVSKITGTGAVGTKTIVTITDGSLTAKIALMNQFAQQYATSASAYTLVSDQHGANPGTLLELAAHA